MAKSDTKNKAAKKAWSLYRASLKGKGKKSVAASSKGAPKKKSKWGIGRYIAAARAMDVISRPAQWAYFHTDDKYDAILSAYSGGALRRHKKGEFNKELFKGVYGEIGTGVAMTAIKSRMGVYRGAGKLKILDVVCAVSPELLAYSEYNPMDHPKEFNEARRAYDAGGSTDLKSWSLSKDTPHGDRFWKDKALNVGLKLIQKVAFNTDGWLKLNRFLPKDVNF